ncbi:MAG: phage tail protein [Cyanothece sp. SIO1E1]|nr:phage tail protein [Cyanothece sp. SIO1E1]
MRTYPPVSFFFEVIFQGEGLDQEVVETRFQSVTGLTAELQTESLKEGGENRFEYVLPTRAKYNPLVLKRGLVKDSKMVKWCTDAILDFDIRPMNLLVNLLHVKRQNSAKPPTGIEPLMSWKVINAWPRKWSVSEFDAEKSSVAIESLELNYHYFEALR